MAVSEETKDLLKQVKNGKSRKFVMLTKGTEVVSLVLFKKGSPGKYVSEAKKEGKGVPCHGVVEGKGQDITFKLAIADGFEKAPAKSTALKQFLDQEAELKCKPLFEIVEAVPLVLDDDNPLVGRFVKLQQAALEACDAQPELAEDINKLCQQIGGHLDGDEQKPATAKLDELESLLKSSKRVPSSTAAEVDSHTADDSKESIEDQKTKLAGALKKLKPLMDKAIDADPDRKAELFEFMAKVAGEIKQGQLNDAKASIVTLGKRLQGLLAHIGSTSASDDNAKLRDRFEEAKVRIEPQLIDARRASPEKSNALLNLWNYAIEQGEAENFTSANGALEKLEALAVKLLAGAAAMSAASEAPPPDAETTETTGTTESTATGTTTEPTAIVWRDARELVGEQIGKLQSYLKKLDDPLAARVAEQGLNGLTRNLQVGLQVALQEFDNATDETRSKNRVKAQAAVAALRKFLQTNPAIPLLDSNPFGVTVSIRLTLGNALETLEKVLAS